MKVVRLCGLVGLLGILGGCATSAATQADKIIDAPYGSAAENQNADDLALKHKLQDGLDGAFKGSDIRVVVSAGSVLLVGQTRSEVLKSQATLQVKRVASVKQVYNYLTLSAMPSLNSSSAISQQVSERIAKQQDVIAENVQVITVDGVVYLMGTNVGNLSAINVAIQGAYGIEKVNKVVNLIQKGDQDYYTR